MAAGQQQALERGVCQAVVRHTNELVAVADWIWAYPDIGCQEVEAARCLADLLRPAGVAVDMGIARMATAFKAELHGRSPGLAMTVVDLLASPEARACLEHDLATTSPRGWRA